MENSYTKYLELKEEAEEFNELNKKFTTALTEAKNLVNKLDTKFEYIRSYVTQLETTGNTELTKVYSIQSDISDLSSRIAQLNVDYVDEQVSAYNENNLPAVEGFLIKQIDNNGVYLEGPFGETEYLTHGEYIEFYNNRKQNRFE